MSAPPQNLPGPLTLSLPEDASRHGYLTDHLLAQTERFDIALLVVALALLTFAVVRFHRGRKASPTAETPRSKKLVLFSAIAIFVVIDGALLLGSERVMRAWLDNFAASERDPRTVRVEVNAHQWAWDFRHAGEDGAFNTPDDPLTWNEVRIPVGRPVHFQVASTDVVHGFNLPHFRVQVDAIPGRIHHVWIEAAKVGVFELGCSNHCGTGHYKMRGVVRVMEDAAYEAWLETASQRAATAFVPDDPGLRWGWEWRRP